MAPPNAPKSSSERVVEYSRTKIGHVVDRGECWDLPYFALKQAGAKTPKDLGNDLYVWGTPVELAQAQAGDILQFDHVKTKQVWRENKTTWTKEFNFGERHSAVVESNDGGGFFTLLNAHINGKKSVTRLKLNLSPECIVTGTIYAFRPIARQ